MNKKFIKSLAIGIVSLSLIASCSLNKKCNRCENKKSEEFGKHSSKVIENTKESLENTKKAEKTSAAKTKNANDKKSN